MKKNKFSALFYNNKFVFVISLLLSILIWLIVSTELAPEITKTIRNVPVTIDYSTVQKKMGLEPYGESQFNVDVTVTGKKYIVENDDIFDKIIVSANTGYVNSEGTFSLPLSADTADNHAGFEITELSAGEINVFFDYPKEKEFSIETMIDFAGEPAQDGYYVDDFLMTESSVIKISGPESEVSKIQKVIAKAEVAGPLTQSITVDADIVPVTRDGSVPENIIFNRKNTIAHITVPVYKKAILNAGVSFTNKPADYVDAMPFDVTVSPAKAEFGLSENKLENTTEFEIANIDFASLKEGKNVFTVNSSDITGGVVTDSTEKFTVTVNVNGMKSVTIETPSQVEFINTQEEINPESYDIQFNKVKIIGPEEEINELNSDNAVLYIDMSKVTDASKTQVTAPVILSSNRCWLSGEYTATVILKEKQ